MNVKHVSDILQAIGCNHFFKPPFAATIPPTMPPIVGQCDLVYFNKKRYKNHPDTDDYHTYYLFPCGSTISNGSTKYNAYTVRYGGCDDLDIGPSSMVARLSNVTMKL